MTTKTRKRPRDRRQGTLDPELGVIFLHGFCRATDLALRLGWSLERLNRRMAKEGIEASQRNGLPGFGRWISHADARTLIETEDGHE